MRVLVVDTAGRLGVDIATELAAAHQVMVLRQTGIEESAAAVVPQGRRIEIAEADLLNAEDVSSAVRGAEAVVHPGELPRGWADRPDGETWLFDWFTRGTHILLKAAVDTGARRLVMGSTLDLFSAYPDHVYITENHRPLPGVELTRLVRYLGEQVCREFARDHHVSATILRLGHLVLEEEVAGHDPDPMWLDRRDAVRGFCHALERDDGAEPHWARRWRVLHLCAQISNPKYLAEQAQHSGYEIAHRFAASWASAAGGDQ